MRAGAAAALLLAGAAALSAPTASSATFPAKHARLLRTARATPPTLSQDSTDVELAPETIVAAAETAAARGTNVASTASDSLGVPPPAKEEAEPFDPRIILYVSLPAVVLGAQLFFTFSRDALTGDAVGPAVMDLLL